MVILKEFLKDNVKEIGTYALVTIKGKTDVYWFFKVDINNEIWFLEAPCQLYKIANVEGEVKEFCKGIVKGKLENEEDEESYVENYLLPMVYNNVLYGIKNPQVRPFLPVKVQDVKLINLEECLEFLLSKKKY